MTKIFINGRFLTQKLTGISRFSLEICRVLCQTTKFNIIAPKNSILKEYDIEGLNIIEYGNLNSHLWEQISLPLFLRKQKDYILINFSGLGPIFIKSKISTIHDVSFVRHPEWFSKQYSLLYKVFTPLIIKNSICILTVSKFSKNEIIDYYNVSYDKIKIIYNAINNHFNDLRIQRDKHNVISVASFDPRKNIKTILEASTQEGFDSYNLTLVGSGNRVFGQLGFSKDMFSHVTFTGHISDSELIKQYNNSSIFISASLYEGFGIPPLEALACGCKLLLSDIPVYHEIFEDAAVYFNPMDPMDLLRGLIQVSKSKPYAYPQKILSKFSWYDSAMKVKSIIETITKH